MDLLRELHRGGATICMVTHDPRYAAHADRSIHLFDGRVVEERRQQVAARTSSKRAASTSRTGELRRRSPVPATGVRGRP